MECAQCGAPMQEGQVTLSQHVPSKWELFLGLALVAATGLRLYSDAKPWNLFFRPEGGEEHEALFELHGLVRPASRCPQCRGMFIGSGAAASPPECGRCRVVMEQGEACGRYDWRILGRKLTFRIAGGKHTDFLVSSSWRYAHRCAECDALFIESPEVSDSGIIGETWQCPACGEVVEKRFYVCWNCAYEDIAR